MRRDNLLLFSYILFIIICFVCRILGEYEQWSSVVSAIAIASALLSCAEHCSIYANYFSGTCVLAESFIKSQREYLSEEEQSIAKLCEILKNPDLKVFNLSESTSEYSKILQGFKQCKDELENYEAHTNLNRKKQSFFLTLSNILTVGAFLSLSCIITFPLLAKYVCNVQDIVSVLAFAVILISQYANSHYREKVQNEQEQYNAVVSMHNQSRTEIINSCNEIITYFQNFLQEDNPNAN